MTIFWKVMLEAVLAGDAGHVFTRTPLWVPLIVQFWTVIPVTSSSFGYLPRRPILDIENESSLVAYQVIGFLWCLQKQDHYLIPRPGPHITSEMKMLVLPGPMETQSSPTPMTEEMTLIFVEWLMWMPSVFGLSQGAVIVIFFIIMLLLPCKLTWKALLFIRVMLLIVPSEILENFSDWINSIESSRIWFR